MPALPLVPDSRCVNDDGMLGIQRTALVAASQPLACLPGVNVSVSLAEQVLPCWMQRVQNANIGYVQGDMR